MDSGPHQLVDNTSLCQYEFRIDGFVPRIEYLLASNGVISLNHTAVPPELEGQGIASELLESTLEEIDRRGLKLAPRCPYVVVYIRRHPAWRRLLADGSGV